MSTDNPNYTDLAGIRMHIWTIPSQNPARDELAGHLSDVFPRELHGQRPQELEFFWRMDVAPAVVGYSGAMVIGTDRLTQLTREVRDWAEHRSSLLRDRSGESLGDEWADSDDTARDILVKLQGYLGPDAEPREDDK